MERGAWKATVHGTAKSQQRLKRLSTDRIDEGQGRHRKSRQQVTKVKKVKGDGGLDYRNSSEGGEKRSQFGCILNLKLTNLLMDSMEL